MGKKDIKPGRAFWVAFIGGIAFVIIMLFILGGTDMFKSSDGIALIIEMCFGSGLLWGCGFGLVAWLTKRNQKMNEKDELNDLMRQYLERKLREEQESENKN